MSVLTRKIKLIPVGDKAEVDRVYTYLRNGIKNQNLAMNQYISSLYAAKLMEISKEDRSELNKLYTRISASKKGSAYSMDIQFAKGLPTTSSLGQKVRQDFDNACKKGLMYGKISLPSYRDNNPLLIHVDYVRLKKTNPHLQNGLYHNYETHEEFLEHLKKKDVDIFIKFANGITFKLVVGVNLKKSASLRAELRNIFEELYDVNGSSIGIDGKSIILNLSFTVPDVKLELDKDAVVGVDLGVKIPAMCALNNNEYKKLSIGSIDDFFKVRNYIRGQKRKLQKDLAMNYGGHGRSKKMTALDRVRDKESSFAKTYNHMVSKRIVDFAVQNKAKYINIEDLSGYGSDKNNSYQQKILSCWSYFQLQNFITYKAKRYGIEVRKIKPAYTSQTCSVCGNLEEGQRESQERFVCKSCGAELNADYNAARNIAKSTSFSKE